MERLGLYLQEHLGQVLIGVGVLATAAVIVGIVLWLDHRAAEQAFELEHQATRFYLDRPIDKPQEADQHLTQAIALYRQLLAQYPRSPSAPLALFQLGNALVQANDLKGAVEAYQKYIAGYPQNKLMLGLVLQRLAYAQLLQGDAEAAIRTFTLALETPGTLNKDQVLFELGKIEEARSHAEGALARYQELIKSYPNSPFAGEAGVRAKALEAKQAPADVPVSPPAPSTTEPAK